MSKLIFSLSKRQRRQLDEGLPLQIALPVDSETIDDPADWFCDRLEGLTPDLIASIRRGHVWTHATNRGGGDPDQVTARRLFGEVVDSDNRGQIASIQISAVIATLSTHDDTRPPRLIRWPAGPVRVVNDPE